MGIGLPYPGACHSPFVCNVGRVAPASLVTPATYELLLHSPLYIWPSCTLEINEALGFEKKTIAIWLRWFFSVSFKNHKLFLVCRVAHWDCQPQQGWGIGSYGPGCGAGIFCYQDVQSHSERVRMSLKRPGSFSHASQITRNGVFHPSAFKCLPKL